MKKTIKQTPNVDPEQTDADKAMMMLTLMFGGEEAVARAKAGLTRRSQRLERTIAQVRAATRRRGRI